VVFAGFSQGVAMAFRAAAASPCEVRGVIAAGGDVPPELDETALRRVSAAVVCHGTADQWYTTAKHREDLERLSAAGVRTVPVEFAGGHEWSAAVLAAAAEFLAAAR
jgi:predicted esterase